MAYDPYESFLAKRIFSVLALTSIFLSCVAWSIRSTISGLGANAKSGMNIRHGSISLASLGEAPLFDPNEPDPWKRDLYQRLDQVRTSCGALCAINDADSFQRYTTGDGPLFRTIEVPVDCDAIMMEETIDVTDTTIPFPLPEELLRYFAMENMIPIVMQQKLDDVVLDDQQRVWSEGIIEQYRQRAQNPQEELMPPFHWTSRFREAIERHIPVNGKQILVMGSSKSAVPWVEGLLLHLGASHVTTLVDANIVSEHPRVTTMTSRQLRAGYRKRQLTAFDAVVSYSSLDHEGLGRYGDSLNPWADLIATARARCITKKGGHLAVAVPTGHDNIRFNLERKYGGLRYPLLGANWMQVDGDKELLNNDAEAMAFHPTFVFQNP